jgi:catechol 2,3-dioxygenase-like lactoylglutathione lyase family enzyme
MNLDALGIVSRDIAKSIAFYKILGVDLIQKGEPDHFEGSTPSGVRVMLDSVSLMKRLHPGWQEPSGCGVILCFVQNSPPAVDALYANFLAAEFTGLTAPWDAFWGQRHASVLDPDGNQIDCLRCFKR